MTIKELIELLKKYEKEWGELEVVNSHGLISVYKKCELNVNNKKIPCFKIVDSIYLSDFKIRDFSGESLLILVEKKKGE